MLTNLVKVLVGGSLIVATACTPTTTAGTGIGAGAGAIVGGVAGGWGGALIGGAIGGVLGYGVSASVEEYNRQQVARAIERDRAMSWQAEGNRYRVEPTRTFVSNGRTCRNYRVIAEVDGRPRELTGTACRRPDGTWQAVGG